MRKFIISVGGEQFDVDVEEVSVERMYSSSRTTTIRNEEPKQNGTAPSAPVKAGAITVDAPMPGNILRILVSPGDVVSKGQKLFVLEAMKMENEIGAPTAGRVAAIKANAGDAVMVGQNIIVLE